MRSATITDWYTVCAHIPEIASATRAVHVLPRDRGAGPGRSELVSAASCASHRAAAHRHQELDEQIRLRGHATQTRARDAARPRPPRRGARQGLGVRDRGATGRERDAVDVERLLHDVEQGGAACRSRHGPARPTGRRSGASAARSRATGERVVLTRRASLRCGGAKCECTPHRRPRSAVGRRRSKETPPRRRARMRLPVGLFGSQTQTMRASRAPPRQSRGDQWTTHVRARNNERTRSTGRTSAPADGRACQIDEGGRMDRWRVRRTMRNSITPSDSATATRKCTNTRSG